ncbi:hypothetical protein T492DRAFT_844237 [Pavlovales sp. CCMP2436]|nr:hypothetical protein T492DRAFT_844237 [Pavlovales sp. CCMP2436]
MPEEVVSETTYLVTVFRYIPGQTQQRNITWASLDTPTVVVAKWKATMSPAVAYAGFTQSFGHEELSFDSDSGNHRFAEEKCDIEITRNPEGSSSISFYNQLYKPVIRICGGSIVSNAYTGTRLPSTIGYDSYFSGNIIGRAQNGDPYNVIDSITYLNTELIKSKEVVNILSCTATTDSWLITTDKKYNPIQVVATPAYNPTSITALNKASPVFLSSTTITSSDDWQVATGWRVSSSSVYQNNDTSFDHRFAFDRNPTSYWASAEAAFSSTDVRSQYVQIEYPEAVKMTSYKIDPAARYTGAGTPIQRTISASNNKSTFVNIESFGFNLWQANTVQELFMSVAHVPDKYWRLTITLIKTTGAAIHTTVSDISFISGWSVGMTSLRSAQPVDLSTFKLILGKSYGVVVSMIDTPIDWQFNLLLIKSGRILIPIYKLLLVVHIQTGAYYYFHSFVCM